MLLRLRDEVDYIWIAQKPCGCVSKIAADIPAISSILEEWESLGLVFQYIPRGFAQFIPFKCCMH